LLNPEVGNFSQRNILGLEKIMNGNVPKVMFGTLNTTTLVLEVGVLNVLD
jgi:hypothetical protein